MKAYWRFLAVFLLVFPIVGFGSAPERWVGSWSASQQLSEPQNSISVGDLRESTLRQIVHLSIGGTKVRLVLSNRFGTAPFHIAGAHIAQAAAANAARIITSSDKRVTFSGNGDVTIPVGAEYVSDVIEMRTAALSNVAITLYLDQAPTAQTGHPGSRATSYLVHGNALSAEDLPNAKKIEHWYFIAGVDVMANANSAAIVALGDSITDGHGATTDANDRWPDLLANRLQAGNGTQRLAILNAGIGGNRVLIDGLGPNGIARFDHDVLVAPGVQCVIVLEGINDLGMMTRDGDVAPAVHQAMVRQMLAAYTQMITRAHSHGIKAIGATLLPFVGSLYYHPGSATESDRQAINSWIRAPGHFDGVIDFDRWMRDPGHPGHLLPAYDSGDHLHPSPAGYAAMADAIPLSLFSSLTSGPIAENVRVGK